MHAIFDKTLGAIRALPGKARFAAVAARRGLNEANGVLRSSMGTQSLRGALMQGAKRQWMPGAIGAGVGAVGGALSADDHKISGAVAGGLIGGGAGIAGGMAWRNRSGIRQLAGSFRAGLGR